MDADRVRRAAGGDAVALQQLLLACHDRLGGYVHQQMPAVLRDAHAPEDVLQEVYVRVFQHIGSLEARDEVGFWAWLCTIARNQLADMARRHQAAKRGGGRRALRDAPADATSLVGWLECLAVSPRTPSRSMADHEAVAAVRTALEALKPEQAEALRLRHIEGLDVAAVAARMKRSPGAVRMLCQRGLTQMQEVLGRSSRFFSHTA